LIGWRYHPACVQFLPDELLIPFLTDPGFLALDDISVTPAPEPGSMILLLSSAIVILSLAVRRRARNPH